MSVQVIENWSDLRGSVLAVEPHRELQGYAVATIHVIRVSPVPGYADLFSAAAGSDIDINVSAGKWNELGIRTGDAIQLRVRKAGPLSAFADPDSIVKAG